MARRLWLFPLVWILVVGAAVGSSSHGSASASASKTTRFHVLGHADPGGGYSGDVVGEQHYA